MAGLRDVITLLIVLSLIGKSKENLQKLVDLKDTISDIPELVEELKKEIGHALDNFKHIAHVCIATLCLVVFTKAKVLRNSNQESSLLYHTFMFLMGISLVLAIGMMSRIFYNFVRQTEPSTEDTVIYCMLLPSVTIGIFSFLKIIGYAKFQHRITTGLCQFFFIAFRYPFRCTWNAFKYSKSWTATLLSVLFCIACLLSCVWVVRYYILGGHKAICQYFLLGYTCCYVNALLLKIHQQSAGAIATLRGKWNNLSKFLSGKN